MDINDFGLTDNAKTLISVLFKEYISQPKIPFFYDILSVQKFVPQFSKSEVTRAIHELEKNDLIDCNYGSNEPAEIKLTKMAIKVLKNN